MFRATPTTEQKIDAFKTPFIAQLNPTNRWVVLAKLIPWDQFAQIYYQHLDKDKGRKALDARIVIGAMIIKHLLKLSDRESIAIISENPYMQHFLGLDGYQTKPIFDASLFVTLRKRMGQTTFDDFTSVIIKEVKAIKPKGKGKREKGKKREE